jgi:hypothetical protein
MKCSSHPFLSFPSLWIFFAAVLPGFLSQYACWFFDYSRLLLILLAVYQLRCPCYTFFFLSTGFSEVLCTKNIFQT